MQIAALWVSALGSRSRVMWLIDLLALLTFRQHSEWLSEWVCHWHSVLATCHLALGTLTAFGIGNRSPQLVVIILVLGHFRLYVFRTRFVVFSQGKRITGHTSLASTAASGLEKVVFLSQDSVFWFFSFLMA